DDAKVKTFWREHWGEWQLRAPQAAGKRYAPILRRLREDPRDFKGAFLHIDRRLRMMALFELQSFVWNEGVKRYLGGRIPAADLIGLRYQAGALVFPRSLPRELRDDLWNRTFPLLAPDSQVEDPRVREAALGALRAQGLALEQLRVPDSPLFFKHEERPLFIRPGKLRVHPPRPDELNRGKRKVNLSFTLPPGAYATLVVRRVLWFATETARPVLPSPSAKSAQPPTSPPAERERSSTRPGTPAAAAGSERAAQPQGFLARQRARKAARAAHRAAARNPRTGR
ncbi:MAG TPA: tRNA pseudouridine(13) synthase TruD, partial [Myxococcales bacterium]|nr:tRNA pseudouridine(13) synthase TruD [Myxococcales bacterium]